MRRGERLQAPFGGARKLEARPAAILGIAGTLDKTSGNKPIHEFDRGIVIDQQTLREQADADTIGVLRTFDGQ
jgi:hypothetical protein